MFSGICSVCGCTDRDCSQCIEATGKPCYWVDDERQICSRCYIQACESDLDTEQLDKLKSELEEFNEINSMNISEEDIKVVFINTGIDDKKVLKKIAFAIKKLGVSFENLQTVINEHRPKTEDLISLLNESKAISNQFRPEFQQKSTPKAFGQKKLKVKKFK